MLIQPSENKLNKRPFIFKLLGMDKPYFIKTPWWLKKIYSKRIWDIDTKEKIIYLTFDDGPHPAVTPFVLDQLKKYNAKATFFCIGKNVQASQYIYQRILKEGHGAGNHTNTHLNGYKTADDVYLEDIRQASASINSSLFRPPYGRMTGSQLRKLPGYKIVMWDVLCGDFDESLPKEKCLEAVLKYTKAGSIVVLHDSAKAKDKVEWVLPAVLEKFSNSGWVFSAIPGSYP